MGEYPEPNEVFWAKRTAEISQKTGKGIGKARPIVTELLWMLRVEVATIS